MSSLRAVAREPGQLVRLLFRVVAVTVTIYPAFRKFFEYSYRVGEFESYGMPFPELAVPVTGVIEIVAMVSIALGIAGRLGGSALAAGMVVAIVAAGPNPASVLVLLASAGIAALGTGPYSYWDPTFGELVETVTTDDRLPGLPHGG
jgi:uncharacterized membrane protein YphA (DoxX/SURF4 family)